MCNIGIHIIDHTFKGKCSNCGQCCSNALPMSRKEVKTIKRYIKKHQIAEQRHNAMQGIDMTCPFRNDVTKSCLIYEVRPEICRKFQCNNSFEYTAKCKFDLHKRNSIVFMRHEFYGSEEEKEIRELLSL